MGITPPLSDDHIQERVDGSDDPLCSFVARQPAVFLAEALGRARLEQAVNVARQLRPNAAFGTQTGNAHDGAQRAAEVALLVRSGKRRQHGTVALDYERWEKGGGREQQQQQQQALSGVQK